ncbi:hypothetical protein ACH5RR_008114 [Cinchona calisaya]|uniref:F-box domain-containing protein n=1 Tax=Cinchona calisaya TaxID=153742 RepID=A0ABD3AAR3_9GENT
MIFQKQNVELHGLDTLPDEILIVILSCLTSFKEAVRTSVLSRRWRYLWRFTSGSIELDFDQCIGNCSNRNCYNKAARFLSWVDQVVKLHEGPCVDKFIVRCVHDWSPDRIYDLIRFAMQKEVRVFELNIPYHRFPDLDKFLSISRAVVKPPEDHFGGGLSQLTSLTLVKVSIDNEMMDPSLKSLIVCFCAHLRTLTISATNLVSFEYGDSFDKPISKLKYQFQNVPLLSELKLKGVPCRSLLLWPSWHSEYSHQLERLLLDVPVVVVYGAAFRSRSSFYELPQLRCLKQLELKLHTSAGEGHLFFVMLTTACPLLSRFVVQGYSFSQHDA